MTPYHLKRLRADFSAKQRLNPSYSLRAYAKYLHIHAPTLSAILNGKRGIPKRAAETIADRLQLSPVEKRKFLLSALRENSPFYFQPEIMDQTLLNEQNHYQIIAEWEHYAILNLARTKNFKGNIPWVAGRLGISEARAQSAIDRLIENGFLTFQDGQYQPQTPRLKTTEDIASKALRESHRESLQKAAEALDEVPVELRDLSSICFPADVKRLKAAKDLIREFRRELAALLEQGECTEVYELTVNLYPLTRSTRNKKGK